MLLMKKFLSALAVFAVIAGIAVAVGKYLKSKGIDIRDALDYKNDYYPEDDDIALDEESDSATEQQEDQPDEQTDISADDELGVEDDGIED